MEIMIKNGSNGNIALVDERQRLHTQAVTFSATQQATGGGRAFNINTGWINISAESAIFYFKNDEEADFVVDAVALGVKNGDTNNIGWLTVIRNPTAGDIITNALAVDMNENRNFGSSSLLKSTTLAYKGATGNSFTDGDDIAMFAQGDNGRLFATVDFTLSRGSSLGLRYEPSLASGTVDVYAALIGFIKDTKLAQTE